MATRHEKIIKKADELRKAEKALEKKQEEYQEVYCNAKDD